MRRRTAALALLLAAACAPKAAEKVDSTTAPGTVAAAPAPPNTKADEDSIKALGERWKAMLATHDTAGIAALYADDGSEHIPNQPAARGTAAVAKAWGGLYHIGKDVKLTFDASDLAVAASGDLAVERGTYQLGWTDAKGKPMNDHGGYVTTFKKLNGQWKVFTDMNTSEVPTPGM